MNKIHGKWWYDAPRDMYCFGIGPVWDLLVPGQIMNEKAPRMARSIQRRQYAEES